ncbi:metallophosphoesterase [Methanolobus psychrotolerans]|uniref:metallophosphoesterase n=1 Tax=Methanolobus psychrotolerans TaxID=1874706 RepID=UPI000B91C5A6|nr:metallophosphoesterase [Methanolobus psychrotolerans]
MEKTLFCELNNKVSVLFESEPAVVHVDFSSVILVGDLHGNIEALDLILEKGEELNCKKYIFLGDYVDRGDHSVELLSYLFKLKINHPDCFILLRGNHETAGTNAFYGLYDDLDKDDELFSLVNRTFEKMPIAAVLNENVFCVHGGIGEPVTLDLIEKEDYHPYLWNDPQAENGLKESPHRSCAQVFGPDICEEFLKLNRLDMIIRAHSELEDGYKWWFDGQLLSLFSTPEYCGSDNRGAFVFIEHDGCKTLDEALNTFVFGRSEDGSYSLLKVISHNSEIFEFYDSETGCTISIIFRFLQVNNILVTSYDHGGESPLCEGAVIADEYTFTEANAVEKVIIECRSIKTLDDLYPLLAKHSLEWKRLLDVDEEDLLCKKDFKELNKKVSSLFERESAVIHIERSSAMIVGDLHGNLEALVFILEAWKENNRPTLIFLGDFVDGGDCSIEILQCLFQLKIERPGGVFLLKGTHETAETNRLSGLYDELNEDDELFALVNSTFKKMPIAAVLNERFFCVHGGIGHPVTLDLIKKEDHHPYLWNDPQEDRGLKESPQRWGAELFGPDICEEFLRLNGLEMIIRARSESEEGYKWSFNEKLLSLFSTPGYCGSDNKGAFALIEDGKWKPVNDALKISVFGNPIVENKVRHKSLDFDTFQITNVENPYSLIDVVGHDSEKFEFYNYDSTISIHFYREMNEILVKWEYNGYDNPCLEGAEIVNRYTFTEPNIIDRLIAECESIETSDDMYALLKKHNHVAEQILVDV